MAYTKTTFVNGRAPAVSAEELNKIGQGLEEAHNLAEFAKEVVGTYTGNGAASRFINLGFTPSAVLLTYDNGQFFDGSTSFYGGFVTNGNPARLDATKIVLEIVTNGFNVYYGSYVENPDVYSNTNGKKYNFVAFK